jgi:hypothetical protein
LSHSSVQIWFLLHYISSINFHVFCF